MPAYGAGVIAVTSLTGLAVAERWRPTADGSSLRWRLARGEPRQLSRLHACIDGLCGPVVRGCVDILSGGDDAAAAEQEV